MILSKKDVSFPVFLQLPGIQFQGCHSDIISFLAFAQVDRSSGSHEARRVSELRSELWGVLFRWSGANGRLGGSRVRFVFCSEFLDHSQNENVNIGLHEMAQMVWESMFYMFVYRVFLLFWEHLGKFWAHTSYRKQVQVNNPKVGELQFFFEPAELQHPMFWGVVCDPWNVYTEWQGTIYSSFQRQVIDIQNAKTGHHGKVIQYIKKDCATWKCNMKGNWWNHGNTAEWGEHNFPSLVLGTVCKFVEKNHQMIFLGSILRTIMEKTLVSPGWVSIAESGHVWSPLNIV